MRVTQLGAALAGVPLALSALAGAAYADSVSNKLDGSIDAIAEIMPLTVGGATGITTLYVSPTVDDGKNGCNLTGSTTLGLSIASSDTTVATVSPSSVTFTSCGDIKQLTVTPVSAGSATISATQTSNTTDGTFDLAPVTFTVNVTKATPTNTAPAVEVTGVTGGASYTKGSVPPATCKVTDVEDGPSSFAATLSAVTGPLASDGIGSQTASCSYTDADGLTAASSVTYSIVDASAPTIGYTLDPATPDGAANWYRRNVTLTWHVSEPDSPHSLVQTGCVDQTITADQFSNDYKCSAASAGGTASEVTVSIQRDGNGPDVAAGVVTAGTQGDESWYRTDVTASFTASDKFSGVAGDDTKTATSSGEGDAVVIDSPAFSDVAGNTTMAGTKTVIVKVDKTPPSVGAGGIVAGTLGNDGWYLSDVTASFLGTDGLSGVAGPNPKTATSTDEGEAVVIDSPAFSDVAGNVTGAGAKSVTVKVDKTDPSAPTFSGLSDGAQFDYGDSVPQPTCSATDAVSGFDHCDITGGGSGVGPHSFTATAYDKAGRKSINTLTYTVNPYRWTGFYAPVDMGNVVNTVKAGSTVPLKFEVFNSTRELTDTAVVKAFNVKTVNCASLSTITDGVEMTSTGGTSLRYDSTAGQFIQNWKTPTGAGVCYSVSVTTNDGVTQAAALFRTK